MTQDERSTHARNLQRAAAFFRRPVWSRLFDALYEKYIVQGRIAGQIVLYTCTAEEQREIARFLQKRFSSGERLVVRLSEMQRALNESGFPCELAELLIALYPERSHVTRPQERERRAQTQQHFSDALSALVDALPAQARGRRWLLQGAHGREYLFRRYKNEDPVLQEKIILFVRNVIDALNQLPTPPAYERLSAFAQRISGDPHRLDAQSFAGRLFLHALQDLTSLAYPQSGKQTRAGSKAEETGEAHLLSAHPLALPEEDTTPSQEHEHQRHLLYYEAQLLTDTISSTVAVFQLVRAEDASGQPDPLITYAGSRVLVLPLRQVLAWEKLAPASEHVYLFENPQVFEDIIDGLQQHASGGNEAQQKVWPTLICTSGWPSVATIRLLNLLTKTAPNMTLHYSGDFDLPGLRIAVSLQKRYPAHCQFWHLDSPSYLAALHHKSEDFDDKDLTALQALPPYFAPLLAAMQENGKKAYQEGITHLLLKDICATALSSTSL
jgi:uncharacterized protein (TIGR02679 family)